MKYVVALLLMMTLTESSVGQIREKYIHKHPYTNSSVCTYGAEHIYFNVAKGGIWELSPTEQWLMKYSLDLNPKDSIDLYSVLGINSNHFLYCKNLKEKNGVLNLIATEFIPDTNYLLGAKHRSFILQLDSNLQKVSEYEIADSNQGVDLVNFTEVGDFIYGTGFSVSDTGLFPCLIKLNKIDSSFKLHVYDSLNRFEVFADIQFLDSVFLVAVSPGKPPRSVETVAILDTSLELLGRTSIADPLLIDLFMLSAGYFIDRKPQPPMVISSAEDYTNINLIDGSMKMGVAKLDWSYTVTQIDTFRFSGADHIFPNGYAFPKPYQDACDYISPDSVLFSMAGQEFVDGLGYQMRFPNDVYIYNYNAQTEDLNWLRVYNNGYTQNVYVSVEVLPNNQYLVILNEYNWDKYSYPNLSIHLMILNANGDLINNPELPYQREVIRAFPNPCSNHVVLSGLEQVRTGTYSYQLIDINGALIEEGAIQEDNQIFFKDAVSDTRVLQVLSEGRLVQSILVMGE